MRPCFLPVFHMEVCVHMKVHKGGVTGVGLLVINNFHLGCHEAVPSHRNTRVHLNSHAAYILKFVTLTGGIYSL